MKANILKKRLSKPKHLSVIDLEKVASYNTLQPCPEHFAEKGEVNGVKNLSSS